MDASVYTLLIVESPTMAGIIQKICPPSVYVLSTDGYCWRPAYDASSHQLKAIADPKKRDLRKELREQSRIANTIVVAVDSDASGDFIAWSLSRFIKSSNIKRGRLQGISQTSIHSMLSETTELDESQLERRLKNRFLIHHEWSKYAEVSNLQLAGLISVFGVNQHFHSFLNENNVLYKSTSSIHCNSDEWISVRREKNSNYFKTIKPLSTFDVLEYVLAQNMMPIGYDSQLLLNQLFQTLLPFSEESLISYPRTSAQAFYSDTWAYMRKEHLKKGSVNDLKPTYLQEIADAESPHESIHPIELSVEPNSVIGELSKNIGRLYEWIYNQTIQSLSMPEPIENAWVSDLNPDVAFYSKTSENVGETQAIRPCLTVSELGLKMDKLGVIKPSNFGKALDDWISRKWIQLNHRIVTPGKHVLKQLDRANALNEKLSELNRLKEEPTLKRETVVNIITS